MNVLHVKKSLHRTYAALIKNEKDINDMIESIFKDIDSDHGRFCICKSYYIEVKS